MFNFKTSVHKYEYMKLVYDIHAVDTSLLNHFVTQNHYILSRIFTIPKNNAYPVFPIDPNIVGLTAFQIPVTSG